MRVESPAMSGLEIRKTYKLYLGGEFVRSESGHYEEARDARGRHRANVCRASRKDLRDAVTKARAASGKWAGSSGYLRGQILYRLAEMMEIRVDELAALCARRDEVETAVDRVVWYAGWADKLAQVIGSANPVAGPYFNFTIPEPTGVVGILAPDEPSLDGLLARVAPALVGGNAVVVVASESAPIAALELAEAVATSDLPGGVLNVLSGFRAELGPALASHLDVNAIDVTGVADAAAASELERLAADGVKRVVRQREDRSPWEIAAFLELKTVWHPIGQ